MTPDLSASQERQYVLFSPFWSRFIVSILLQFISLCCCFILLFCYVREEKETRGRREIRAPLEQLVLQEPGAPQERMEPRATL